MSTGIDALPQIPTPLGINPWPTFSIPLEERQTGSIGELPYTELDLINSTLIIRSSEPEAVYVIASIPGPLLPIFTPDLSLEKPALTPFPSTSGSPRRMPSHIAD